MYKQILIAVLLICLAGCGKSTSKNTDVPSKPLIQGEVTQTSYANAANETLAHAAKLVNYEAPTEQELDGDISKIEALLALAKEKGVDKAHTQEIALTATAGTLYARKAAINKNKSRIAGELIATSFRYLDKAISLNPHDLRARINRGLVSSKVPDFLGKAEIAHEDLIFVRDNADFKRLAPKLQDTVKQNLAEVDSRLAKSDRVQ